MSEIPTDDLFWAVHRDLPREAPGSERTTRLLLELARPWRETPRIVDMGCGPGASAVLLAVETGGTVLAVDTHEPFLTELAERARRGGVAARVHPRRASMDDPGVGAGSRDLIWAEGSAYSIGVDHALAMWRPLLAAGGAVVLTEVEWTTSTPHPAAQEFWSAYPAMRSTAGNVEAFARAGWDVTALYRLPDADWEEYYGPQRDRIAALRTDGASEADLAPVIAEIELRDRYPEDYAYTGYILRPRG